MAFFDFLKDAKSEKKAVGSVLNFLGPKSVLSQTARDIVRGVPRGLETIGRSAAQLGADIGASATGQSTIDFDQKTENTGVRKFILGKEPLQTVQTRFEGNKKVLSESRFRKGATPLAFLAAGLTVAGDATPLGSTKKKLVQEGEEAFIKRLAKTATEDEVKKLLKDRATPAIADRIAGSLALTKDPEVVRNILSKELPAPVAKAAVNPQVEEVVSSYAQQLKSVDTGARGGQMIPDGTGGYKRTTEHSKFYSQYFAEHGRAPTKLAWKEEAARQLQSGKADSAFQPFFDEANNPEIQSLLATEARATSPTTVGDTVQDLSQATYPNRPQNVRGTIDTITKKGSTPELRAIGESIDPKKYTDGITNPELIENARKSIATDEAKVLERVKSGTNLTDQDVASSTILTNKAIAEGRIDDAVAIVNNVDNDLRQQGRAIQANSLWERLSPEGVLKLAAQKIRQARDGFGKAGQDEGFVAKNIRKTIDDETKIIQDDVDDVVRGVFKDASDGKLSTGEQLAKNVEGAVKPKVKKKADELVAELTKKVKQEYLDPKKVTKRSPTNILREVFDRNIEAKEAYPLAQELLWKKFENVPTMQKALRKFFESELKLPAANSTVNAAIKEQLAKNGEKISNIIYKSWDAQKTSVDDIAQSLVKEGFDEQSAKQLAEEVTTRLTKQVGEAKTKALQRLSADAPQKNQKVFSDKISKLSNLGALDDGDYLQLARAQLKLPDLTPELAKELSALAQKMQGLPDGAEKFKTVKDIQELISSAMPKTKGQIAADVLGTPKAVLASADVSGGLRQGAVLGVRFPKEFAKAFVNQFKYFKSTDNFNEAMAKIAYDPLNSLISKDMKVALTGSGTKVEEAFASQLAERFPGLGRLIAASDRAYTGFLTELRFNSTKHIIEDLKDTGIDIAELSPSAKQSIGRFINTASGRGDLGMLEKHAQSLGQALFSPRLWKSRLDMLNPVYYARLDPIARKYALQSAGTFAAVAGTVLSLAALAGAEVETDARSSDFLKIKIGNTRYDILGGFQQNLVFAHREITGEKKSSTTGSVTKLGEGFGSADRFTILSDLIQNKENPVIATGTKLLKGKDAAGNPYNKPLEIGKLFVPLSTQDTIKSVKDSGPKGILKSLPGYLGVGGQTYGKGLTVSQNKKIKKLEDSGASREQRTAYEEFYKTYTPASGLQSNTNDKINEALAAGDTKKARKLAADYNKKYSEAFDEWRKQYGKYTDKALTKDYKSGKINLTSASIKQRKKSLKEKQ